MAYGKALVEDQDVWKEETNDEYEDIIEGVRSLVNDLDMPLNDAAPSKGFFICGIKQHLCNIYGNTGPKFCNGITGCF